MKNRIISLVLTLSLCASLLVLPAHAYDYQPDSVGSYGRFMNSVSEGFLSLTGSPLPTMDSLTLPVTGPVVSLAYVPPVAAPSYQPRTVPRTASKLQARPIVYPAPRKPLFLPPVKRYFLAQFAQICYPESMKKHQTT